MPLARNANSTNVGGSEFKRADTANSLLKFCFLDLGNLSDMSFRVFSGTTAEKRVFFLTNVLPVALECHGDELARICKSGLGE